MVFWIEVCGCRRPQNDFADVLPVPTLTDASVVDSGALLPISALRLKDTTTARPTPTLIRKVLLLFLPGGLEGRSSSKGSER